MRSFMLQNWATVQASSTVTTFTQSAEDWVDVSSSADMGFWVDVAQVTGDFGSVQLVLQSSPTRDESYFGPIAVPMTLAPTTTPALGKSTLIATTVPVTRFVRWQLQSTSTSDWSATFRVRAGVSKQSFFSPVRLAGCVLWLRADLGITLNEISVSGWADQSGAGNNFSQTSDPNQPVYSSASSYGVYTGPVVQGYSDRARQMNASWTLGTGASTLVMVFSASSQTNTYLTNGAGYIYGFIENWTGSELEWNNAPDRYTLASSVPAGLHVAAITQVDGVSLVGYFDGVQVFSHVPAVASQAITEIMGALTTDGTDGDFVELLQYNRALSSGELGQLNAYLTTRYGV